MSNKLATEFWDRINYIHGNRYLELISQLPVEKTEEFCAQITMNPIVQMRHIEEHPELPWDWTTVCHNPNFTNINLIPTCLAIKMAIYLI